MFNMSNKDENEPWSCSETHCIERKVEAAGSDKLHWLIQRILEKGSQVWICLMENRALSQGMVFCFTFYYGKFEMVYRR